MLVNHKNMSFCASIITMKTLQNLLSMIIRNFFLCLFDSIYKSNQLLDSSPFLFMRVILLLKLKCITKSHQHQVFLNKIKGFFIICNAQGH